MGRTVWLQHSYGLANHNLLDAARRRAKKDQRGSRRVASNGDSPELKRGSHAVNTRRNAKARVTLVPNKCSRHPTVLHGVLATCGIPEIDRLPCRQSKRLPKYRGKHRRRLTDPGDLQLLRMMPIDQRASSHETTASESRSRISGVLYRHFPLELSLMAPCVHRAQPKILPIPRDNGPRTDGHTASPIWIARDSALRGFCPNSSGGLIDPAEHRVPGTVAVEVAAVDGVATHVVIRIARPPTDHRIRG